VLSPRKGVECGRRGAKVVNLSRSGFAAFGHAGVAALLVSHLGRRATPTAVYDRIRQTSDDLGLPGPDALLGHGRANALRALQS